MISITSKLHNAGNKVFGLPSPLKTKSISARVKCTPLRFALAYTPHIRPVVSIPLLAIRLFLFCGSVCTSFAATLPPQTPFKVAKADVFIGVSPLLVVMLACGSLRADRAVMFFAGFIPVNRSFFSVVRKLPPSIQHLTTPHTSIVHSLHFTNPTQIQYLIPATKKQ